MPEKSQLTLVNILFLELFFSPGVGRKFLVKWDRSGSSVIQFFGIHSYGLTWSINIFRFYDKVTRNLLPWLQALAGHFS